MANVHAPGDNWWGWWDGRGWSCFVTSRVGEKTAAISAGQPGAVYAGPGVEWCDYYPKNARVPRVNPQAKRAA